MNAEVIRVSGKMVVLRCKLCGRERHVLDTPQIRESPYCRGCRVVLFKGPPYIIGECGRKMVPAARGRGEPCYSCPEKQYLKCLDKVARLTYWPGWRLEDEEEEGASCEGAHSEERAGAAR